MEKGKCLLCSQEIFPPLLDEYKNKKLRAIALIKAAIKEAYDETEKGATLFATELLARLEEEL